MAQSLKIEMVDILSDESLTVDLDDGSNYTVTVDDILSLPQHRISDKQVGQNNIEKHDPKG